MQTRATRADAAKNREVLLVAVGRLLERRGELTLVELAAEAGLSRATTYRNFSSPDEAVRAYVEQFLAEFEHQVAPLRTLAETTAAWVALVEDRGPALVHVRSAEGFLARVRRADPVIGSIDRIVRHTILTDPELDLNQDDTDYLVFLWNILFDPRELLDLASHRRQRPREVAVQLLSDLRTIIEGRADRG